MQGGRVRQGWQLYHSAVVAAGALPAEYKATAGTPHPDVPAAGSATDAGIAGVPVPELPSGRPADPRLAAASAGRIARLFAIA